MIPNKPRTIRSFVRRKGRITPAQQQAIDESWAVFGLDYSPSPIELDTLYTTPVDYFVIEIGFGNGDALIENAANHPEQHFLGIEVHEPGVGRCLLHASEQELKNLRVSRHDAIDVLKEQITEASVDRLNLYFPDPWPKKRHHKRRIISDSFLTLVAAKLKPAGKLCIATDWDNYAESITEIFAGNNDFELFDFRRHDGSEPLDRPATHFERRGVRLGHQIHDWQFSRR